MDAATALLIKIADAILNPLILLMFAAAFLVFLWGAFQFVMNADSDDGREKGRSHLLWGFVGMLIMLLALVLIQVIADTIGAEVPQPF
jgi:uncharacterized membrane protein YbhN (UPF0104 family)